MNHRNHRAREAQIGPASLNRSHDMPASVHLGGVAGGTSRFSAPLIGVAEPNRRVGRNDCRPREPGRMDRGRVGVWGTSSTCRTSGPPTG